MGAALMRCLVPVTDSSVVDAFWGSETSKTGVGLPCRGGMVAKGSGQGLLQYEEQQHQFFVEAGTQLGSQIICFMQRPLTDSTVPA